MAAAVSDFTPAVIAEQKIKKADSPDEGLSLSLSRTPDILTAVKMNRVKTGFPVVTVGFAAESQNLLEHARSKLERKGLDLLVANDITARDAGFEVDTNRVVLLSADSEPEPLELTSKARVGEVIIERVAQLFGK
jgi:phosphopantothenoylcysteine decarboxylase/phosphopantothenate--cysteine ligase